MTREELQKDLEYHPIITFYKGEFVKVTLENYEEITGRKLPEK